MYKLYSIILFFTCFIFLSISSREESYCYGNDPPRVALNTGCVEGYKRTTALVRLIFSFQGIPYAAPPIGKLRFKAPQPAADWTGVLKAVNEPPACIQPRREVNYPITYNEDCLYVSVHTPNLEPQSIRLMPVIVWIHGGKYFQGSGSSYKYGTDFLLTKDVVVVTMNYRLGIFGYLNLNISEAQGNAAMKDKVAALKWVKQEISKFGGDPNSVTIAGGSSGAGDVNYLYISPMAKGLFHRAISNSGSSLCTWAFLPSTISLGLRLAQELHCPSLSPESVVSCFRDIDAIELAERQMILGGFEGLDNPFIPSVESDMGEELFLPDTPQSLISSGGADVPYIIGMNNAEGLMTVKNPYLYPGQFDNFEEDIISYLPAYMLHNGSPEMLKTISSKIIDFYNMGNTNPLQDRMYGYVKFDSDKQFCYCILKAAEIISTRAPVYLYLFAFEGEFQVKTHEYNLLNMSGVCHGEELGYIFYRNYTLESHNNLSNYPRDMAIVKEMVNLWTNFAKYGNPTPMLQENITWEPVKGNHTRHLIIGDTLKMNYYSLIKEREYLWDSLNIFLSRNPISEAKNYVGKITVCVFLIFLVLGIIYIYKIKNKGYESL